MAKLGQTWRLVESLPRQQQEVLAARINALLALAAVEEPDLKVRTNPLTMKDNRAEQKAARAARRA